MTNKGVIPFKFTYTESEIVEIGDFKWNTDRRNCPDNTTGSMRCDAITCKPKKESPTVLWNCLTVGTLAAVAKKDGVQCAYYGWHFLYGNNWTKYHVVHKKEKVSKALGVVSQPDAEDVSGEVHVEIME
ncbi:hypothetical protein L596_013197 [Steinernema carpocapsae]|uniref:Uncharacterized protein n=1 Tax=Steinernema carpocapsae TaxID=34508 RepID=A0A4U5NZE6_STECR|nr:hypothetical protein L596_013197 [Steinernema carpocapsae]